MCLMTGWGAHRPEAEPDQPFPALPRGQPPHCGCSVQGRWQTRVGSVRTVTWYHGQPQGYISVVAVRLHSFRCATTSSFHYGSIVLSASSFDWDLKGSIGALCGVRLTGGVAASGETPDCIKTPASGHFYANWSQLVCVSLLLLFTVSKRW
jgi:hypothetical protein